MAAKVKYGKYAGRYHPNNDSLTWRICKLPMRLNLRPEWRLWPFTSFLGLLDLKTGVTMALLFAVRVPSFFFYLLRIDALNIASQQSSGYIWSHRRVDRCGRNVSTNQSIHIFGACSRWPGMGPQNRQGSSSHNHRLLHRRDHNNPHRKIQNTPFTLPICFLPTIFSPPRGPSSSPSFGGCILHTTAGDRRILRRRKK
jgi:hypothetical protein